MAIIMNNLISVIIPTYNRCDSLKSLLNNLLCQESKGYFDFEIIVVDNNSSDDTRKFIRKLINEENKTINYLFEPRQGKSYALNLGIQHSKGDIIAFTDDDCIVEKNWLLKIWETLKQNSNLEIVLGEVTWENGKSVFQSKNILRGNGANMICRRKIFDEIGIFDTHLGPSTVGCSSEDLDLIYRARRLKRNIEIIDDISVIHRERNNSIEELNLAYRNFKGRVICWLKYVVLYGDVFAIKNIYWRLSGTFIDLINAILSHNPDRIKLKFIQLSGMTSGLLIGPTLWIALLCFQRKRIFYK